MQIKEGLKEKFDAYVAANSEDPYSKACVDAMVAVGDALDRGVALEEAHDALYGMGLTGFMAGAAIEGVVRFHPRGEEMRVWWNKRFGVEGKEGVVNPAIVEVESPNESKE